jgi:hypothetical protein
VHFRTELEGFLDIAPVGNELWAMAPGRLTRLAARDGSVLGSEPIEYVEPGGRFLQSSIAPQLPVWHCAQPVAVRASPAGLEVPGPGGEMILPIAENRWLLWHGGQLRLWRSAIGEAWRKQVPGLPAGLPDRGCCRTTVANTVRTPDRGVLRLSTTAPSVRSDRSRRLVRATRRRTRRTRAQTEHPRAG